MKPFYISALWYMRKVVEKCLNYFKEGIGKMDMLKLKIHLYRCLQTVLTCKTIKVICPG